MAQRRAVYTALLGDYEELGEQPTARESGIPFICFTDQPGLTSDTWTVIQVETSFPFDLVRSQRDLKIRGHELLGEYDETLYIDNSVLLLRDPGAILDEWLAESDFAVSLHSFRSRVIDEFDEIVRLNYDDAARVHEQLLHYAELYPDVLYERPYWNGMLARRHTKQVTRAMGVWFDHVLRYSRRDQLSANVALSIGELTVNAIDQDNTDAPTHRWPVDVKRKASMSVVGTKRTGPLLAEVARLERELAAERERSIELPNRIAGLEAELVVVRDELAEVQDRLRRADATIDRLLSSVSWRVSRPIRVIGNRVRRFRTGGQSN